MTCDYEVIVQSPSGERFCDRVLGVISFYFEDSTIVFFRGTLTSVAYPIGDVVKVECIREY